MNYNLDIQKLVLKAQEMPTISAKLNFITQAIAIADRHQDVPWGLELRLFLLNTENSSPSSRLSFIAFTWILNQYDQDPDCFEESDFLYEYKWLFAVSQGSIHISKSQFLAIGDDFHNRLLNNGYSSRAYYHIQGLWYQHLREHEKCSDILELLKTFPIDDMSNNPAFELALETYNLIGQKKYEEALQVGFRLLNNSFEYMDTGFETYCVFAYEFYLNKDSRAREFFDLAALNLPTYEPDDCVTHVRARMLFMFLKYKFGDISYWEDFEKMCKWEYQADDYYSFAFLKSAVCILDQEIEIKLNFPVYLPYYKENGIYSTLELRAYFYERAYELAKGFDQRNETTNFVDELNFLLST